MQEANALILIKYATNNLAWHARGQRFDPAYLHQLTYCLVNTIRRSPASIFVFTKSLCGFCAGHGTFFLTIVRDLLSYRSVSSTLFVNSIIHSCAHIFLPSFHQTSRLTQLVAAWVSLVQCN